MPHDAMLVTIAVLLFRTKPWTWAQCDLCLKWRRLQENISENDLPDKWYCRMNRDLTHKYVIHINICDVKLSRTLSNFLIDKIHALHV